MSRSAKGRPADSRQVGLFDVPPASDAGGIPLRTVPDKLTPATVLAEKTVATERIVAVWWSVRQVWEAYRGPKAHEAMLIVRKGTRLNYIASREAFPDIEKQYGSANRSH